MFQRRTPMSLPHKIRDFLWPRAGWKRSTRYLGHRLGRLPGTPYSIACGFGIGAATSFTPFLGFHFVISAAIALMFRANIAASLIGTAVGNPWTFPLIWGWVYASGVWILGEQGNVTLDASVMKVLWDFTVGGVQYLGAGIFFAEWDEMLGERLHLLWDGIVAVIWPMIVGCLPSLPIVWAVFFFPLHRMVSAYQTRRMERRAAKGLLREENGTSDKDTAA